MAHRRPDPALARGLAAFDAATAAGVPAMQAALKAIEAGFDGTFPLPRPARSPLLAARKPDDAPRTVCVVDGLPYQWSAM